MRKMSVKWIGWGEKRVWSSEDCGCGRKIFFFDCFLFFRGMVLFISFI